MIRGCNKKDSFELYLPGGFTRYGTLRSLSTFQYMSLVAIYQVVFAEIFIFLYMREKNLCQNTDITFFQIGNVF